MLQCDRTPGEVAGQPSVDSSQRPSLTVFRHSSSYQACGALAAPKSVHEARERLKMRRKVTSDATTSDRTACFLLLLAVVEAKNRCPPGARSI